MITAFIDWLDLGRANWLRLLGFYALVLITVGPWLLVLRAILTFAKGH